MYSLSLHAIIQYVLKPVAIGPKKIVKKALQKLLNWILLSDST